MNSKRIVERFVVLVLLVLVAGCGPKAMSSDTKSNWLRQCSADGNCASGLACICGVCTKACETAAACDRRAGHDVVCVTPEDQGLPPECRKSSSSLADQSVCLQACTKNTHCAEGQGCVRGVCVNALIAPADEGDAGTVPSAPIEDAGARRDAQVGQVPSIDAGLFDAGPIAHKLDASAPEPLNSDEDASASPFCDGPDCRDGLVCHIDGTCVVPGQDDGDSVATLTDTLPYSAIDLFAADENYVYGANQVEGGLLRWPVTGGRRQPLAGGAYLGVVDSPAIGGGIKLAAAMDSERLYFIAFERNGVLGYSLYSMPKDDSAPPSVHGLAGQLLVQDTDYLYFSNDGDSRVLRVQKSMLDVPAAREEIYVSAHDSPGTIVALAVNGTSVFVGELPTDAQDTRTYDIRTVDKQTKQVNTLVSSDRLTATLGRLFADDRWLLVAGGEAVDRIELSSLAVKPIRGQPGALVLSDGALFTSGLSGSSPLVRIELESSQATSLLAPYPFWVNSIAVGSHAVFATMGSRADPDLPPDNLIRVARP